ncbi:HK97 family phage prohead protease [Profundibacterium mesophilum]|uniref:Phage prohead protease n=1 Tax=Profundibacterium mesophilum KAUST100406-0324 TaxID=1037889 RepID=A0A921TEK9_9RHOB|nr:HK97 family phage prohead protease [Profundibacterium mesophilum]KAF0677412.1 Phage prohead protease [Profundibacterium mesophilum KAUST100406-0324]
MTEDNPSLERKFCGGGSGLTLGQDARISGYASLFGARDSGGDVVGPGAFAASLAALAADNGKVRMLWQHDPGEPIGVWDEVREDARGLFVEGRLLTDVARGREAASLLAAGAIDGLSIGYRVQKATRDDAGQRLLTRIELWEVSLVTFPMLPSARVAGKAVGEAAELRKLGAGLRRAGRLLSGTKTSKRSEST